MNWHSLELEKVKQLLSIKENGFSTKDVELRILTDGENTYFKEEKITTVFSKIFKQLKNIINIILLLVFIVSVITAVLKNGEGFYEPLAVFLLLILNVVLGIIMEERAEAEAKKRKSDGVFAKVLRDGVVISIKAEGLVPGDIIYIEQGDIVPADGRLVSSLNLKCEESEIIGEAAVTEKNAEAAAEEETPLKDRKNMIYSGCTVTYGTGTAIVTETGKNTVIGKLLSENNGEQRPENSLLKRFKQWSNYFGAAVGAICLIALVIGLVKKEPFEDILALIYTAALAAVPECIFIVTAVISKCGKKIYKTLTGEKLGRTTVICTEKTGVLTKTEMTAAEVWTGDKTVKLSERWSAKTKQLMEYAVLCSDINITENADGTKKFSDDPTENAIIEAADGNGIKWEKLLENYQRADELPFDSARKLMTTIYKAGDRYIAVVKGAPEVVVSRCPEADRRSVISHSGRMAKKAMRVIAVAVRELDGDYKTMSMNAVESSLKLVGLIGMTAPAYEDTLKSVKRCKSAGIKTVMVTGDHIETAVAVAEKAGICKNFAQAISGTALKKIKISMLEQSIKDYTVFARVSPADKLKIVKAYQNKGETVVMTGKDINDVAAIKCADIGCVIGKRGSNSAREAADILLKDGNFSSLVSAVKEGRFINLNIKRIICYLLSCSISEVTAVLFIAMFSLQPLNAALLLVLNLLINSICACSFWKNRTERDIMLTPPPKYNSKLFSDINFLLALWQGVLIGLLSGVAFLAGKDISVSYGITAAFLTLALSQVFNSLSLKGIVNLFKTGIVPNKKSFIYFGISLVLTFIIVFAPFISEALEFVVIGPFHIALSVLFALIPAALNELVMLISKNKKTSKGE